MKMDLSPTQKANIRKRLKAADDVVMKIQQSGVECNALVRKASPGGVLIPLPFRKGYYYFQEQARGTGIGAPGKEHLRVSIRFIRREIESRRKRKQRESFLDTREGRNTMCPYC